MQNDIGAERDFLAPLSLYLNIWLMFRKELEDEGAKSFASRRKTFRKEQNVVWIQVYLTKLLYTSLHENCNTFVLKSFCKKLVMGNAY